MQRFSAALVALFVSACAGDANDSTTGDGGSGGGAGSSGSAGASLGGTNSAGGAGTSGAGTGAAGAGAGGMAGASGEAVRGAVSLHILSPEGCSLSEQYQDFPKLPSGHPVTAAERQQGIAHDEISEEFPATVLCRWIGSAPPYTIDAVIRLGPAGRERVISLGGPMVLGEPVSYPMVVNSYEFSHEYTGTCTYTPLEVDEASRSVWGEFTCDSLDTFSGTDPCAMGPSYYFFENCTAL